MTGDEVLAQVRGLRQWRAGEQRAPHKPLLLLLALGRLQQQGERLMLFDEAAEPLRRLLEQFGPPRRRQHPEYPFWRLRLDGQLWEIEGEDVVDTTQAGDPRVSSLRRHDVRGGLSPQVAGLLLEDDQLFEQVVAVLLESHFPPSLHEDICTAAGLRIRTHITDQARRDPEFRIEVLRAYEYRCAMCGYDGRLDTVSVGLDAAHVQWWAYGGPDDIDNGTGRARELVIDLSGKPLYAPQHGLPLPAAQYLSWHGTEVFSGEARAAAADVLVAEDRAPFGGSHV